MFVCKFLRTLIKEIRYAFWPIEYNSFKLLCSWKLRYFSASSALHTQHLSKYIALIFIFGSFHFLRFSWLNSGYSSTIVFQWIISFESQIIQKKNFLKRILPFCWFCLCTFKMCKDTSVWKKVKFTFHLEKPTKRKHFKISKGLSATNLWKGKNNRFQEVRPEFLLVYDVFKNCFDMSTPC